MSEIQVASRYAKSLIDLAEEQNALEPIKSDIESFLQVVKSNAQLAAILRNPIINPDKKLAILDSLFGSNFNKVVLAFFRIMVNKGRAEVLYSTAKEFMNEYNKRKGIVKATVTSAAPLSAANLKAIEEVVKSATSSQVMLETKIDKDLIGGFVLKVGDRQFDASLVNNLNKLKKEFAQKVSV
ncbi:ATP synthase F1 subunit delta [Arcticibacter sp. MXS-1]|uniref:ATP synthase F1 subunit delta n=1 Tax=Arcticibacter sp. MXS-1 TaxID=3341726 RepID=UPI0035A87EEF